MSEAEVFAPRPTHSLSRRGFSFAEETDDDPTIVVPLEAYASSHRRNSALRAVVVIVVLLAFAGGVWMAVSHGYAQSLMAEYGPAAREKLELFRQELRELRGEKPAASPASTMPGAATTAPSTSTIAPSTAASSKPTAPAPTGPRPADVAPPSPKAAADSLPSRDTAAQTDVPATAARTQTIPAKGGILRVPASTMEENLVSSRVPAYPESARARRLEGSVVMEAMISRLGTVERVHVLSGDSRLRPAAIEAVLKWRYKPYRRNGSPMEVITQVRVPFRLGRR